MRCLTALLACAAAGPLLAGDAADMHRLCRPGPADAAAMTAGFVAAGWKPASDGAEVLAQGLAMVTPFLGDIDPTVMAAAAERAVEGLPEARAAIATAQQLQGPGGTRAAILPYEVLRGRPMVRCLAVYPADTPFDDVTAAQANLSLPITSGSLTVILGYEAGYIGGATVVQADARAYGWDVPYMAGPIQYTGMLKLTD